MHRKIITALIALITVAVGIGISPAPAGAATGPDPVIIVAGTFSPAFANEPLAERLRARGHTVEIFELPGLGTGDIRDSARQLDAFADGVRARHGAQRVDLVGHSQGGLVARAYVKYEGGAAEVDSLVSLGAPHYGTYVANLAAFLGLGNCLGITACEQMTMGSSFLTQLNAGDDTIGSVRYTNIYTAYDELVRPVTNATLADGATNVKVQSQCWFRPVGHVGLILDGAVADGVDDALDGRSVRLNCWAW